jgi:hypothetical protein
MKHKLVVLFVLLLTALSMVAQTTETVRVSAGNDIAAAVSAYGMYRFAAFTDGSAFFKDGSLGKELFNYNILNDQIMYIDKKGDTLAIAFPDQLKKVTISGINFYYDKKGYLEEIANAAAASLVVKRKIIIHYEKEGAFGISSATNAIDSYTTYTSNNSSYHIFVSDDVTLKKLTSYFLLTTGNQQLPATKANFFNLFPGNRENIERYLDNHKVNFNREQDLVQLLGMAASGN